MKTTFKTALLLALSAAAIAQPRLARCQSSGESAGVTNDMRGIVQRALPVIRQGGQDWINENDCLSCHRVGYQVWSLNRAAEAGFDTDADQLGEWNTWATTWENLVNPDRRHETSMKQALTNESDTVAQLLLGRPASPTTGELEWITTYRKHLLRAQQDDGSWDPKGQLPKQKRDLRETRQVTTMWTLLGLRASGPIDEAFESAQQKARKWLDAEPELGQSTEWWAVKLLVDRAAGHEESADSLRSKLLAHQHDDGGWGWLVEDDSDALGTGIALYALGRDGLSREHPAVQRAARFLSKTQQPDGSWPVHGTKQGYRDQVTETASYWGACWTVIGLLEFEHDTNSDSKRSPNQTTEATSSKRSPGADQRISD